MRHSISLQFVSAALTVCGLSASAFASTFQGLGDLPGGTVESRAYAVTNSGVVGGWAMSANGQEAYRWTSTTGMQPMGDFSTGTFGSGIHAINGDGSHMGGFGTTNTGTIATEFRVPGPVLRSLGSTPTYQPTWINGMSADGTILAGFSASGRPFRSTPTATQQLPDFAGGGTPSDARAVSADGSTVVGSGNSTLGLEAFRYTVAGGLQGIGDLPGGQFESRAWDVNADGSVIVGSGNSTPYGSQAFRWTPSGIVGLPAGGTLYPRQAMAVSDDGNVVVGSASHLVTPFNSEPFIWDPTNGTRSLIAVLVEGGADLTGWSNLWVEDISPDGLTIVGYGRNANGADEAFIATIPEPTSVAMLTLAAASLLRRARRVRPRAIAGR